MKKTILTTAALGLLSGCIVDDRERCEDVIDGGVLDTDAGTDGGCVYTEVIYFPDQLITFER
jgi:hypothetical protein